MAGEMTRVMDAELVTTPKAGTGQGLAALPRLPELAKALAKAQKAALAVEKDRRNQFHGYDYASAEAVITEGKHLADAGLALLPLEQSIDGSAREGADRFEVRCRYLLLHDSGEALPITVAWPIVPDKGRPLDKAAAAAVTLSLSYLIRGLLLLPRVEKGADVAAREDHPAPAQKPSRKPAPPANGTPPADAGPTITRPQADELRAELARVGRGEDSVWRFLHANEGPAGLLGLTVPQWDRVMQKVTGLPAAPAKEGA